MEREGSSIREWLDRLEDAPSNRFLAAAGYIPFFCFVPILARRDDEFARFHGKQSLILLAALIGIWILIWLADLLLGGVLGNIFIIGAIFRLMAWLIHYLLGGIVSLGYFVAIVTGAFQALAGREWRIPIIAAFARELPL